MKAAITSWEEPAVIALFNGPGVKQIAVMFRNVVGGCLQRRGAPEADQA